jgi:branched-chain amino acid aminotransferase
MELPRYAYFQGEIVPYSEAKVGVLTHALNYGTAAFAGLRAYWNPDQEQLFLFRPRDHYRRLLNSARLLLMEFALTPDTLSQITIELLKREGYRCNAYVRPLVYKSDEIIGVKLHGLHEEISIVAIPFESYLTNDTNAHVTVSSWRRVDDNMIPACKISGYVPIGSDKIGCGQAGLMAWCRDGHLRNGA